MTEVLGGKGDNHKNEEADASIEVKTKRLEGELTDALRTIQEAPPERIKNKELDDTLKKVLLSVLAVVYTRASVRLIDKGATNAFYRSAIQMGPTLRGARASFVAGGFLASLPAVVPVVQTVLQYVPRKLGLPDADSPAEFVATISILGAAAATVMWETISPSRRRAEEKKEAAALLEHVLSDEQKISRIRESATVSTDALLQTCGEVVSEQVPTSSVRNAPLVGAKRGGTLAALVAAAIGSGILTHASVRATTGAAADQVVGRILAPGFARKGDPVEMFVQGAWKRFTPSESARDILGASRKGLGLTTEPPKKK